MEACPDNISGHFLMAGRAEDAELYDEAGLHFKKAVEFSPMNDVLIGRMATFYGDLYNATGMPGYKEYRLRMCERVLHLAPNYNRLAYQYQTLRGQ